jgi:hypothetical protein
MQFALPPIAPFVHPLDWHRLPPPCALQNSEPANEPFGQSLDWHRLPPPCAAQYLVGSRAPRVQPSDSHRFPPPCRTQYLKVPLPASLARLMQPWENVHRGVPSFILKTSSTAPDWLILRFLLLDSSRDPRCDSEIGRVLEVATLEDPPLTPVWLPTPAEVPSQVLFEFEQSIVPLPLDVDLVVGWLSLVGFLFLFSLSLSPGAVSAIAELGSLVAFGCRCVGCT